MTRRARARWVLVLFLSAVIIALAGSPAAAHGELERSDPVAGGTVAEGRSTVSLWFTEPIDRSASTFVLRTLDGHEVSSTVSEVEGGYVALETDPLATGVHSLDWDVLSAEDGHRARGTLVFGVGVRPDDAQLVDGDPPSATALLLRWIMLLTLLVAIGGIVVARWILPTTTASQHPAARRVRQLTLVALMVSALARSAALWQTMARPVGPPDGWWRSALDVLATPWGMLWTGAEALLIAAALAVWRWSSDDTRRQKWSVVALCAVGGAVLAGQWAGHASALPERSTVAALIGAVHVMAAGVWAGALLVLLVVRMPGRQRGPDQGPESAGLWRRFSPWAASASVVLLASGVYESGRHLDALGSITSTVYGTTIVGKVALVTAALALAAVNTVLVNSRVGAPIAGRLGRPQGWTPVPRRQLRRLVAAEVAVLVVAVAAAALLTSVPTARDVAAAQHVAGVQTGTASDVFLTLEGVRVGEDATKLIVRARSTTKLETAPISGVSVELSGPSSDATVALQQTEPGRYEAITAVLGPGSWVAWIVVARPGLPDAVASFEWSEPPPGSGGPTGLEIGATATALALVLALAGCWVLSRHPASRVRVSATTERGERSPMVAIAKDGILPMDHSGSSELTFRR